MIGRWRQRRRATGDRGATLVEFAVVSPLIFFMLGGMLDIGLTVLGRSVASGAAREGARVGIIHFENADIDLPVASPNNALIKAAVDAKLVGLVKPDTGNAPYVAVRCLDGGTKAAKACTRGGIRIDYDLIEVTVKWRSISATGGTFTPSNLTDVARMVIVGDAGGGGVACVGSGGTIGFSPLTASVTEGNSATSVSLTVTRSAGACVTTVAYATSPTGSNPATADSDYTTTNSLVTFLVGETSKTISIPIIGDAATEPNETFAVTLSSAVNGTIGGANPATVTIVDDDAVDSAPSLTRLRMFDADSDGKIDLVWADFDEVLAPYTAGTSPWTLSNVPSAGSLGGVSVSGMRATLSITEGLSAADTAVGSFTVALAPNANGVRDAAGNQSSFTARAPEDQAGPVPIVLVMANGGVLGSPDSGDTQIITFSEVVAAGTICQGQATTFNLNANGDALTGRLTNATPESLTVTSAAACSSNLSVGLVTLGAANLVSADTTFSGNGANRTEVSWTAATKVLRVELGTPGPAASTDLTPRTATYTPSVNMTDAAGNTAAGSVTFTGVLF